MPMTLLRKHRVVVVFVVLVLVIIIINIRFAPRLGRFVFELRKKESARFIKRKLCVMRFFCLETHKEDNTRARERERERETLFASLSLSRPQQRRERECVTKKKKISLSGRKNLITLFKKRRRRGHVGFGGILFWVRVPLDKTSTLSLSLFSHSF